MKHVGATYFILMFAVVLSACQRDIPKPENNVIEVFAAENSIIKENKKNSFHVKSFVRGNNVFIECMITNFSFRERDHSQDNSGKMLVLIDGKRYKEYSTAAFIIKDLESGHHRITLQIVNQNGHLTSLKREIVVVIPS
jgi:hypothetical protein